MQQTSQVPDARVTDGLLSANPLLRLGLGVCAALAVTTTAVNGLAMGIATACVLLLTELVVSLAGSRVSKAFATVIAAVAAAAFATIAQMILRGWFPALHESLGIYVPLMAVSSLILVRGGEACGRGIGKAVADGLFAGIGYALALTLVGAIRELIGRGSLFGAAIFPAGYEPMLMIAMPAGGLLVVGILMGIANAIHGKRKGA